MNAKAKAKINDFARTCKSKEKCQHYEGTVSSTIICAATKMKIYKCAVGALFTYGSEAWNLSTKQLRTLNGANAACLYKFTGKNRVQEARERTHSLCTDVRRRRLIWLGYILRMPPQESSVQIVRSGQIQSAQCS